MLHRGNSIVQVVDVNKVRRTLIFTCYMVMSFKITIRNSGESFRVEPGESILNAAKRQNVTLPYGCDNGVCGACVYRIIEGAVEYPDGQPFALFEEDIEAGKGLSCVGYPDSDMLIELEYPNVDFEPWV